MVGYDEMDPLNALGQQRGEKCLSGFYGACGNLKAKERFKHENMCLLSICEDPVLKRCDPIKVFSGADPVTGELLTNDDSSPGAQFRAGKGGLLRKVTHRLQRVKENVTEMLYEVLRTSLRVPDGSYGPY